MTINEEDITLKKFLKKVAPVSFPETGKLPLPDADFLLICSLLRLSLDLNALNRQIHNKK